MSYTLWSGSVRRRGGGGGEEVINYPWGGASATSARARLYTIILCAAESRLKLHSPRCTDHLYIPADALVYNDDPFRLRYLTQFRHPGEFLFIYITSLSLIFVSSCSWNFPTLRILIIELKKLKFFFFSNLWDFEIMSTTCARIIIDIVPSIYRWDKGGKPEWKQKLYLFENFLKQTSLEYTHRLHLPTRSINLIVTIYTCLSCSHNQLLHHMHKYLCVQKRALQYLYMNSRFRI